LTIDREWVAIACLSRVRGTQGELEAVPFGSPFERCRSLREVFLYGPDPLAPIRPAGIESLWVHQDRWVFKFRGVDSIDAARPLAGAEVRIPASARPPAPAGEYYQTDLVGCELIDHATAALLGRVVGWQDYGGPSLIQVETPAGKLISVPFAAAICVEIDLERRHILVNLPEGLLELDQS
jgi:16S rRNA processing protein RimM